MNLSELKKKTQKAEEYAEIPPSGRGNKDSKIKLDDILPKLDKFSVRKPVAYIVGSLATHGESYNDIDIVVRGEDWSKKQKIAFDFRLYRLFADIFDVKYNDITEYVSIHYSNEGPFTPYIPIYEETIVPVDNKEKVEMSEKEKIKVDFKGNIDTVEKSNDRRIIAGYASVAEIDSEDQYIPPEALADGVNTLLDDKSFANLMVTHNNIQIGKIIEKYGNYTTHVDENGLYIVAEIRDDLETANDIWECMKDGEMSGFSIATEVLASHKECNDSKCWEVLDDINIFEVSVCSDPINKTSGHTIVSGKSKINKDNMTDKEEKDKENQESEESESKKNPESKDNEEKTELEEFKENWKEEKDKLMSMIEDLQDTVNDLEKEEEEDKESGLVGAIKDKLESIMKMDEISKDDLAELKSMIDKLNQGGNYPEPTKYPYPEKGIDMKESIKTEVQNAISEIMTEDEKEGIPETKSEDTEEDKDEDSREELMKAMKAKDNVIEKYEEKVRELENRVKELENQEKSQKTVTPEDSDEEEDYSSVVVRRGQVYKET